MEVDSEDRPERFQVLRIEGPDSLSIERIESGALPGQWAEDLIYTQSIGDRWLTGGKSLLFEVPSALVPETWNVLVNPLHSQVNLLRVAAIYDHPFDVRIF
jgi:RES domain-containing protein